MHAITTKNCGLLDEKYKSSEKKNYLNTETKFYDFLTVSSDIDRYYSASYTGIDVNKIVVCEPTELTQEFRSFNFQTPWSNIDLDSPEHYNY